MQERFYGGQFTYQSLAIRADNAAMIASVGKFKYQDKDFTQMDIPVVSKVTFE